MSKMVRGRKPAPLSVEASLSKRGTMESKSTRWPMHARARFMARFDLLSKDIRRPFSCRVFGLICQHAHCLVLNFDNRGYASPGPIAADFSVRGLEDGGFGAFTASGSMIFWGWQ